MQSLYTVKSVIVLDSEGKRVCAKYFTNDYPTPKEQLAFEKNLFNKTVRANGMIFHFCRSHPTAEILMWENAIVVYRSSADVMFYVSGSYEENELILLSVLNTFHETISKLLRYSFQLISDFRNQVDKRTMLENLDYVLLALDELVDGG